jgi:hypothetical protein
MGLWHHDCNNPDCDACRDLAFDYAIRPLHIMVGWALLARAVDFMSSATCKSCGGMLLCPGCGEDYDDGWRGE